jgi:hypothetical protein
MSMKIHKIICLITCGLITFLKYFSVWVSTNLKTAVFLVIMACGSCKNRVSEEHNASIIRVTKIGEQGTTLTVTSNRCMLRKNTSYDSHTA